MYEVIESKVYRRDDGFTVSPYGAAPFYDDADRWELVTVGWTVRNTKTGVVGTGNKPFPEKYQAQVLADRLNARI